MLLRHIPSSFAPVTVEAIDARLEAICRDHQVAIPWAIESGSRAWGFPSPDSDYDCRFIFVRPVDQLLSPWALRDVIETPLEGDLDVNGWEMGKALKLLLKGNAVTLEWLSSPSIYRGDPWFRDTLLRFANAFADRRMIGRHYLHLGERQRRVYFGDGTDVPLKKLFYALRPAATLRWLRLHPEQRVPPMHFPTLMQACSPPKALTPLVDDLLARKAITRELGAEPLPAMIAEFIDSEFAAAKIEFEEAAPMVNEETRREAEALFREIVLRYS